MSETVRPIDINDEMRQSYLSYAMSTIVARALPDARDGLKPVQRRILYAMHDMGLRSDRPFRKSARVVGEVLGKYHPHGDQSVYDAMVRMAQDFSLRYMLVEGQGNFGSIDGDPAAAMRYTEARMAAAGDDMLTDLEKNTVEFGPNFDDSLNEPLVLPATIPSLLVNGSYGIAVGMSTSVPPHNLGEVMDALVYLLDHWQQIDDVSVGDLMHFIKGPDFPTGGMVFRYDDENDMLARAYASGRGRITVRASANIENIERNKSRIIITALPYQVGKAALLEKIADLHRDGKLEGLTDLRDESDRTGMRIVLETTRTVDPQEVLQKLYSLTSMESTFSIIMLALVHGEPRILTLKQALRVYLEHRLEVVQRRSEFDLAKARDRAHILAGLLIALQHLDEVIETIRRSRTAETARANLMEKFKLSEIQAQAVLDMPLRRLAALERRKLQDEFDALKAEIANLEQLLASPAKLRAVVKHELVQVKARYADARRTLIVERAKASVLTAQDLIEDVRVWVTAGEEGALGRTASDVPPQFPTRPGENPAHLLAANTRDILYLIAANGEAVARRVHDLPIVAEAGEGVHWTEGTALARGAFLAAITAVPEDRHGDEQAGFLLLATLAGVVKRIRVADLPGTTDQAVTLMRVDDGDALGWVRWSSGNDEVLLATAAGQLIRFHEEEVRPMGLPAGGVAGIKLRDAADGVIGMEVVTPAQVAVAGKKAALVWSITDSGLAKASPLDAYPQQKRNGQGVANLKLPAEADEVVAMVVGAPDTEVLVKTRRSVKAFKLGKATLGPRAVKPKPLAGLSVTKPNRVTGVVKSMETTLATAEPPRQLSLI